MDIPLPKSRPSILFASVESTGRLMQLPLEQIERNADQPRTEFDPAAIEALAASIESQGVIQPIAVRQLSADSFQIVAGERRWLAAQRAGLKTVPAVVHEADDRETLVLALAENLVRENLSPLESARAYAMLIDEWGMSVADIARAVGKSRPAVSNTLRLLELPDPILDALAAGRLTEGHGRALLQLTERREQMLFARYAVDRAWSVRALEAAVRGHATQASTKAQPESQVDREVEELLERLEGALPGLRVRIKQMGARGKVEIRWESATQFGSIAAAAERLAF